MKKNAVDLTLVILHYNTPFWLKKLLTSLYQFPLAETTYKISVVVVDSNSSSELRPEPVLKDFPEVTSLLLTENRGFSAGNNAALRTCNSRYCMLLNSDTECTSATNFDALITYADAHPEVGVLTPKLELPTGELDWACHRGEPTPWNSLCYFLKLEQLFPNWKLVSGYHLKWKELNTIHQIRACSGAACFVRTDAMNQVGLLDEQFFMYAEDIDWCQRFYEAGHKIIFFPDCRLIHHKYKSGLSASVSQTRQATSRHFFDTMLQYYDKHYRTAYPEWVRLGIKISIWIKKGGI